MAPSDDLKSHAASSHDFYGLLGLGPTAVDSEIRRAYRRTALKYHPDKIANPTPADIDKFHLLQIAYDVLSEPSVRQLYDNAREARERKKRENELLEGARRKMKEDLEARERGVKRPWGFAGPGGERDDLQAAEDKLEQEIRRLAEDGKRRRREKEELMRSQVLEEEERLEREAEELEAKKQGKSKNSAPPANIGGTAVPEIDRTVKVRWIREGVGLDVDKDQLESLFSTFGKVESTFTLKDKRQRVGDQREKKTVATGVVVFTSVVGAHAAVEDRSKHQGGAWDVIESVAWASNKQPDWDAYRTSSPGPAELHSKAEEPTAAAASEPDKSQPQSANRPKRFTMADLNPQREKSEDIKKGGKAPSFGSFSSAGSGASLGVSGPSLEEITLIRLKNAERKRLEEQIRKEDEAAALGNANSAQ
ncbi:pre-mRNA-splicing factor cwc23 [Nannizzia gypsea CBS 118893]|uniref:Pre-mRNA-splicing factor cwc23 n=1 Tax=Arthroderma gypseum (strain ATCC MYA-4604 / CBS 118893) TaxID=535722 RepID=E4V3N9_ARTGP|nr:pre-mRNA-splicing factor cwc23 [Nannizzia gypsea CBS 118893]EFR04613.1 pre-mRNA-splicing factor cwc23 [Nannizzia gypsea CBS 118893]